MQKVEGSNPFSRLRRSRPRAGISKLLRSALLGSVGLRTGHSGGHSATESATGEACKVAIAPPAELRCPTDISKVSGGT